MKDSTQEIEKTIREDYEFYKESIISTLEELSKRAGLLEEKEKIAGDSSYETLEHKQEVEVYMIKAIAELIRRAEKHDQSKLENPEKNIFDSYSDTLKSVVYNSDEYKELLEKIKPALEHHYKENDHHPQWRDFNEEWRPVVGYEDYYEVSSSGRVRSKDKIIFREHQGDFLKKGKIMKPHITPKGYLRLQLSVDKKYKNKFVHTLVAEAFIGKKPNNRSQVNHIDGVKTNNCVYNLEYLSPSKNLQHAYDEGLVLGNAKYAVYCEEYDLLTFGTERMAEELRKRGHTKVKSAGIYSCITGDHDELTHFDLHFKGYPLQEYIYENSPILEMDIFQILEMAMDWAAACKRTKGGDVFESLRINRERFLIPDNIYRIIANTYRKMRERGEL